LGRALFRDETVTLNAYRPHAAPADAGREALRREIIAQAREIGSRSQDVSEDEADALMDEAFAEIRGRRE
jgi:CHASE3 domain sensor protein